MYDVTTPVLCWGELFDTVVCFAIVRDDSVNILLYLPDSAYTCRLCRLCTCPPVLYFVFEHNVGTSLRTI
jgi:hypothetical protein